MKTFGIPCSCSTCGGPGNASYQQVGREHNDPGITFVHVDPSVCAYYLEKRRKDLDARERALNAK